MRKTSKPKLIDRILAHPRWARLRRPASDARGSVAVQFAIVLVPLTIVAFGTFDYNRASIAHQELQDALDAATLMAARSNTATTDAQLNAIGQPAMTTNLLSLHDGTLTSSNFHMAAPYITGTATMTVNPLVANLWTGGNMTVTATAQVVRTINNVEVALVLDNTGSMSATLGSGGTTKIAALKTAATSMVNQLQTAATNSGKANAVKIALVPYTMTVNVGSTYQNASWISPGLPSAYGTDIFATAGTNRFTLFAQMGVAWAGCVESRPSPYDVTEAPPTAATPGTMYVPFFAPDEPGTTSANNWNSQTWYNNYLNDVSASGTWSVRQGYVPKYNTHTFVNSGNNSVGYAYGPNSGCAVQPLTRLTTNFSAINTSISNMTVGGDTDITQGLQWGWHAVSPNGPFNDGVPYTQTDTNKIIVLMTDGEQSNVSNNNSNASYYSGLGYIWQGRLGMVSGSTATRDAAMTAKLTTECNNVKAAGITVYVVVLYDPPNDQSAVEACATNSNDLYVVTDTSQLTNVFNAIAGSIQNLRLTR